MTRYDIVAESPCDATSTWQRLRRPRWNEITATRFTIAVPTRIDTLSRLHHDLIHPRTTNVAWIELELSAGRRDLRGQRTVVIKSLEDMM